MTNLAMADQYRECRTAVADARDELEQIDQRAADERRDLTDVESARFEKLQGTLNTAKARAKRLEQLLGVNEFSEPPRTGLDGTIEQNYRACSLIRAISSQVDPSVDAGREKEMSAELERRSGRPAQGIKVPLFEAEVERRMATRAAILTTTGGSDLYPEEHRDDLFIEVLRETLVLGGLGSRLLTDLNGDQVIPKQATASTVSWISEHAEAVEASPTFGALTLTPSTVAAWTELSRRSIINLKPSINALIEDDLRAQIAGAIDAAGLAGDGTNNVPTGILNTAGVATSTFAADAPTWQEVLAMVGDVATARALRGKLGFVANPRMFTALRGQSKDPGSGEFVASANPDRIADYTTAQSESLAYDPATLTQLLFGNFEDLLIGLWSGVDVLANPYGEEVFKRGAIQISAFQDADIGVRHPESFVLGSKPQ